MRNSIEAVEQVLRGPRVDIDHHCGRLRHKGDGVNFPCLLGQLVLKSTVEHDKRAQVQDRQVLDPHQLVVLGVGPSLLLHKLVSQDKKDTRSQHQLKADVDCLKGPATLPALTLLKFTLEKAYE